MIGQDLDRIKDGVKVPDGFIYASDSNHEWMTDSDLKSWLEQNSENIGRI